MAPRVTYSRPVTDRRVAKTLLYELDARLDKWNAGGKNKKCCHRMYNRLGSPPLLNHLSTRSKGPCLLLLFTMIASILISNLPFNYLRKGFRDGE